MHSADADFIRESVEKVPAPLRLHLTGWETVIFTLGDEEREDPPVAGDE